MLQDAVSKDIILKEKHIQLKETEALINISGGDGRKLLNLLDLVVQSGKTEITDALVMQVAQQKIALYDKSGEQHYDIISAFIKSMRGSDPNGAVYWLARMIEGGEDVKFIARRMLIFASEDVGNANPNALLLANAILSQCATYLASSSKSNAAYEAIAKAQKAVSQYGDLSVPLHLRNAATKMMKQMDYGKDYQYSHLGEGNFIEQEYLPDAIKNTAFYIPGNNARENEFKKILRERWKGKYNY
jgi:putative ATPase